ncbi:hypothetical protein [Vibrio crassostreae]|uniref:Uncharacterized protein n=1 Tax=Vibrio crassostreae TaxID=246167 RepID=A0A822N6G0_9VIBR|nr:hypothetical protein [Vibrio crassostreae]MDH5949916.1 hypothetical protein [Vibrio crassostreae]TCN08479.1 hypothetical protein EDB35_107232 [Vibrio crassostreae]TCN93835.1 hypothetical protein EDB30_1319 [Vibrio crassostreae]TCT55379.1 hypothetical protein EDB42_102461 [Vibrio crassostreae]TCT79610.1 hypothetical protein EDB41_102461 [Vibrio crassostreae]
MEPSENSLVMNDENAFKVLTELGNEYVRRGFTNSSNLENFFVSGDYISKNNSTKDLIKYYKPKIEQGSYSDYAVSRTLLNGMVRSGYLEKEPGKYFISELGYNCYVNQNNKSGCSSFLSKSNQFFQEHQTLMFVLTVIGICIGVASLG